MAPCAAVLDRTAHVILQATEYVEAETAVFVTAEYLRLKACWKSRLLDGWKAVDRCTFNAELINIKRQCDLQA